MGLPSLQFAPYRDLAELIADRLATSHKKRGSLWEWPEEVIVASSGVANSIATRLLERLPGGIAGLRLHTIDSFAARVVNDAGEFPRIAADAERRLAMRASAEALRDPLMESRGAPAMLERSYRDVRDSGITLAGFTRRAAKAPIRNRERTRIVMRAWEDYECLIAQLGARDAADVLDRAGELIASGAAILPQILAGFYDLTGAQMALIGALQEVEKLAAAFMPIDGTPSYAFAQPLARRFQHSSLITPTPPQLEIKRPQFTVSEHRTREEEIRGVCIAAGSLLRGGTAAGAIGIVTRALDPYDIHLFARFAAGEGFAISAAGTMPLTAHRFGRAVAILLRLRERDFPRSEVLEIARSGLRVATRINADKADMETRQARIAGGTSAELRLRKFTSPAAGDYVDLVAELEELTTRVDWRLLARLADSFRIEDERDIAACEELDRIADLFTRAARWNRRLDVAAIIDAIEQSTLPDSSERNGLPSIWLGDVMKFRGRAFEHLFAARIQDNLLPQRRTEDPLLSDDDRRALGVREIGAGRDEEHLLFQLICAGGRTVHFSYAASDGFGKPLRPSHYLKTFALEHEPEKKSEILANFSRFALGHQLPPDALEGSRPSAVGRLPRRPLQLLVRAGSRSSFDGYVTSEVILKRAAIALQSISPTQLEDFGECPQKFFVKHILRIRDIDDPEREVQINHRDKGTLDHGILERFYRSLSANEIAEAASVLPRLPETLVERLEQIAGEAFDSLEARAPAHNHNVREMERRATRRVLRDFIAADLADLLANNLMPTGFEYRFGAKHRDHVPDHPEPFIVDVHGLSLKVEGTIDRIDRGGERLRIVDYKSGKALRHEGLSDKIDRGVRLQLAMYALAASKFFDVDAANVAGAIKPLVRGEISPDKFTFALGEKFSGVHETLGIFVDAILRGDFPAFPNESDKDFNSCKYCPVNHSCRTKHDAVERRAVLVAGEPRTLLRETR